MIFDTSSMVKLLIDGEVEKLFDSTVLDLSFYEAGNVFWKKHKLQDELSEKQCKEMIKLLDRLEAEVEVTQPDKEEIIDIANRNKITFYDSSYIATAKENNEKLVTEDKKLRKKAEKEEITVLTASDF